MSTTGWLPIAEVQHAIAKAQAEPILRKKLKLSGRVREIFPDGFGGPPLLASRVSRAKCQLEEPCIGPRRPYGWLFGFRPWGKE